MNYNAEQKARMLKQLDHDFRNHRASQDMYHSEIPSRFPIDRIGWREPGTSNYACDFLLFGNRLIITGDMGESIHIWSDGITPEFVARTDYTYFASKAQGLDGHVKIYDWDPDKVRHRMGELIEGWRDGCEEHKIEEVEGWEESCGSPFEWQMFVGDHQCMDHQEAHDWGCGLHYRSLGHWYGFKKAYAQLTNTPVAT